jgi:Carboxypeptidase regulatory-like domain/TonB dependent receptor
MYKSLLLTAAVAVFSFCAAAQTATGVLQGHVTDSSGAVVPEAKVTIENEATGVAVSLQTNTSGNFSRSFLLPGNYLLSIEKAGFAKFVSNHIRVDVDQSPNVDVQLKVGEISTTVEVTASGTLLSTSQATISTVVDSKELVDLPQNGRNPMNLVRLTPGVSAQNGAATPSMSGGRNGTSEITVDGTSIILPENNVSIDTTGFMPVLDSVEELTVITNSLAAEYGRTGGGAINIATKGGSNALHGSGYDYLQNSALNANSWANNKNGAKKSSYQTNTFGFTLGGPIWIPKVYNGKNRTFFFFSEQSNRSRNTYSASGTEPISDWLNGDFSQLKNGSGQAITIYDPNTTVDNGQNNGIGTRSAFPGNIVPQNHWDPIAKGMLKYFVAPNNLANVTNQFTYASDFFLGGGKTGSNDDKFDSRIDQNFGPKLRMFARGSYEFLNQTTYNACGPANPGCSFIGGGGGGGPNIQYNYNINTNWIYSFSPTLILNVNAAWNHFNEARVPQSEGVCPSSLGFNAAYNAVAAIQNCEFPNIGISGISGLGQPTFTTLFFKPAAWILKSDLTKSHGNHTIKFGAEFRKLYQNFTQLGQPDGAFSFGSTYTKADTTATSPTTQGFGFASFLLGAATGSISHSFAVAEASAYWGLYVQDDWKVSSRLTLNLGIRYETDIPRTERYNRLSYFDINAPSPLPALPATATVNCPSCGKLLGAMNFVSASNRHQVPTDGNNFGPRIGFAYRIGQKTVFRGAYAIMYAGSVLQAAGTSGSSGTEGFQSTTNMIPSFDNGEHLVATLSNPFPNGFNLPLGGATGPTSGALTDIGLGVSESFFSDNANPMIQQWNGSLQHEFSDGILVEGGYIGSKGNHLIDGENILYNAIPAQYQSLGTGLNAQVPNPFNGIIQSPTSAYYNKATVPLSMLLVPYPQYTGINAFRKPRANSVYHAFEGKVQKRFSHGLTFLASLTAQKSIDDASTTVNFLGSASSKQDPWNIHLDRSISAQDISRVFVANSIYELPIGKGKRLLSSSPKVVDSVLGGWQVSGIYTYTTGQPLQIGNGGNTTGIGGSIRPNNNGQDAKISGPVGDRITQYFTTADFSQAPSYTFGTTSRTSPDLRGPSQHSFDTSIFKTFRFHETAGVRLEADMFNVANHPIWGGPNTTVNAVGANGFGTITSKSGNRTMQMVLRISF